MTKKIKKYSIAFAMICFLFTAAIAVPASAQTSDSLLWGGTEGSIGNTIGLGNRDPRLIASSIINVTLGFLGIIAVVIVLVAGFKWMTAGGNEDKIGEAKSLLSAGVIGLVIVLASWGLAQFTVNLLFNATK